MARLHIRIAVDVGFPDYTIKWINRVQFIRGLELVFVTWTDATIAKTIVVDDFFELIISSSVHFSDSQ